MALLPVLLYRINASVSKLFLVKIQPTLHVALLYLGADLSPTPCKRVKIVEKNEQKEANTTKEELPLIIGMIIETYYAISDSHFYQTLVHEHKHNHNNEHHNHKHNYEVIA